MTRQPGEVFEKNGEMFFRTDIGTDIQITQRAALNLCCAADSSEEYAEVAVDAWELSSALSDQLRPMIPSTHDRTCELSRYLPNGVELLGDTVRGKHTIHAAHPDRWWTREKLYMRTFIEGEHVAALKRGYDITDHVRRAIFAAARFLGEHLTQKIELVRAELGNAQLPMSVRFVTPGAIRLLDQYGGGGAFAAFDHTSDRVLIPLASYFVVMPS